MKQTSVSMPQGSAGIVGMSSDTAISGKEIDPKMFLIVAAVLVIIIKLVGFAINL
jgi:preprotein translocase subunit Sec61beta